MLVFNSRITLTLALNRVPEFTYILLYITQVTFLTSVQICSDTQVTHLKATGTCFFPTLSVQTLSKRQNSKD